MFTGRQGIGLHLVDALGEERDALRYLQDSRGVSKSLPVLDWSAHSGFGGFRLFSGAAQVAALFGLDALAGTIESSAQFADARLFNGLVSVWGIR